MLKKILCNEIVLKAVYKTIGSVGKHGGERLRCRTEAWDYFAKV